MKRIPILPLLALFTATLAVPAHAGTQDQARIALHVKAHTLKTSAICTTWSPNTQGLPCSDYATAGAVGHSADVYLVLAHGHPGTGLAGFDCRVRYTADIGKGVDVLGWTLCADFESPQSGPNGEWPQSASSNTLSWGPAIDCQRTVIGEEGVHAIGGAFYLYAYSPDTFLIDPPSGSFAVRDCLGADSQIHQWGPTVVFTSRGDIAGYNPCPDRPYRPLCSLAPSAVDFDTVWVGAFFDSTVFIRNTGDSPMTGVWSVSGAGFSLRSDAGPFQIGVGESVPVVVRFAPSAYGAAAGELMSGLPCAEKIDLLGYAAPLCAYPPTPLSFGSVVIGESVSRVAVVRNISEVPLYGALTVGGNAFRLAQGSQSVALPPGQWIPVEIIFAPTQLGTVQGTLSVGAACPVWRLDGSGITPCGLSPASYSFGSVPIGVSRLAEFVLTNNMSRDLSAKVTIIGPGLSIASGGESFWLAPGGTHPFSVRFTPLSAGLFTGTLSFGPYCASFTISGWGVKPALACQVIPGSELNFGLAQLGTENTGVIRYVNTANSPLVLELSEAALLPAFSLPQGEGPFSIDPFDTLDVPVRFTPLTTGPHVGTLGASAPCASVHVTGFGQRAPVACVTGASRLDFGGVAVGGARDIQFFLFNYTGEVATGRISAPCAGFSIAGDESYQFAWADSFPVTVRFAPPAAGPHTCAVAVSGSCGDTIEVAGYGIASPDTARAGPWLLTASRPDEPVQRLLYEIPSTAHVEIIVFDVVGREMARFDEGVRAPGRSEVSWNARQRPGGIYFARIEAGPASLTCRLLLLR